MQRVNCKRETDTDALHRQVARYYQVIDPSTGNERLWRGAGHFSSSRQCEPPITSRVPPFRGCRWSLAMHSGALVASVICCVFVRNAFVLYQPVYIPCESGVYRQSAGIGGFIRSSTSTSTPCAYQAERPGHCAVGCIGQNCRGEEIRHMTVSWVAGQRQ